LRAKPWPEDAIPPREKTPVLNFPGFIHGNASIEVLDFNSTRMGGSATVWDMIRHIPLPLGLLSSLLFSLPAALNAQAPGVRIVRDRVEPSAETVKQANEARAAGRLLDKEVVRGQMTRTHHDVKLPAPAKLELPARQIWERAQAAYVRVGWHYLCKRCDDWHQNLSGGYFVTEDGVVATCHHVVAPKEDHREAYLIAVSALGEFWPVKEVLAANAVADAALLRVDTGRKMKPLPLNIEVHPGDSAWCFSDPLGRSSYFSQGIVNRFFELRRNGEWVRRMDVSTDWAPGSSGSAVLDRSGNAIGHVSEISAVGNARNKSANQPAKTLITFHHAARAADVLALARPPGTSATTCQPVETDPP
jgi:S1-C subfamily serine protease